MRVWGLVGSFFIISFMASLLAILISCLRICRAWKGSVSVGMLAASRRALRISLYLGCCATHFGIGRSFLARCFRRAMRRRTGTWSLPHVVLASVTGVGMSIFISRVGVCHPSRELLMRSMEEAWA